MSKTPKTKDTTARTALIAVVIVIALLAVAIPAGMMYYFGSSKEYCQSYAEKNAKTPDDGVTDSREMEETGLNDRCMSDRGF